MTDALISLKPRHMANFLEGKKTVELRSRTVNLCSGAKLWIYSTLPDGYIGAYAIVEDVDIDKPSKIWKKYGKEIAISKYEFDEYTIGKDLVSAIKVQNIYSIEPCIKLTDLRKKSKGFQPPQFMKWLSNDHQLMNFLNNVLEGKTNSVSLTW